MSDTNPHIQVISFYKFIALTTAQISEFQKWITPLYSCIDLRGLFIMSSEGVNSTFSLPRDKAESFKSNLLQFFGAESLPFKDSFTGKHPFHDLNVKTRNEIVTLSRPDLVPNGSHHHLSPEEWQKTMSEDDVVVIDTRNSYEYDIGHFRGAVDPKTREFNEFPEWLKQAEIPKEKKVLIYCTGGIRCEKAILAMEEQGYNNVYQLDGGILNYLAKYPRSQFDGECFVFDYRVAVNQELQPTATYRLCPHCGQPAKEKITCVQCKTEDVVCASCLDHGDEFKTCSKNCAHHYRMGHRFKKVHQDAIRAKQDRS
jgi:UPF0176 protein